MAGNALASVAQPRYMKVLLAGSCVLVAYAFGASLDGICNIGGVITNVLWQLALIWSLCTNKQWKRILGFSAAALLLRVSLNPASIDNFKAKEWHVAGMFWGTFSQFGYFSIRPISSSRKVWLYIGTLVSFSIAMLNWMGYASSRALLLYQLHFELVIQTWLLVLATQEIIERHDNGEKNWFSNAMVMLHVIFQYCFCNAVVLLKKEVR